MQSDFSSHSLAVFLLIGSAYPYFTSESARQCQPVIISSCQTRKASTSLTHICTYWMLSHRGEQERAYGQGLEGSLPANGKAPEFQG